jgi:hypothetical protein
MRGRRCEVMTGRLGHTPGTASSARDRVRGVSESGEVAWSRGPANQWDAERERERETARWVPRNSARGAGSGTGLAALREAEVGWIGDSRPS